MSKIPSPCIGVCKYRRGDHCIGCSMSKDQKKLFKTLKKARLRQAFIQMLRAQQQVLGGYEHWEKAYSRKGAKQVPDGKADKLQRSCET